MMWKETFYFLFTIEDETKYRDIYIDALKKLNLFYGILDNIINLYKPEFYYKFILTKFLFFQDKISKMI